MYPVAYDLTVGVGSWDNRDMSIVDMMLICFIT